jgi:2-polyprenyl-3-methyl-5-hydroxy-6-metoxy-1,4-benzoquinol methylase
MSSASACCTICGQFKTRLLFEKFSLKMFKCQNCQGIFTFPMISQTDTLERYSQRWFEQEYLPSYGIDPHQPALAHLSARYRAELAPLELFRKTGRLLDVGAGAGLFLASARSTGWEVAGVEIAEYGPIYAKRHFDLSIVHGTLQDANFPSEYFDVVVLQDTIEHVIDPHSLLKQVHSVLRPGGAVILSTPNYDSLSRRLLGTRWALISPAEHVHLFTLKSLLWLLIATKYQPYRLETDANISSGLVHGSITSSIRLRQQLLEVAKQLALKPLLYKYSLGDEIHSIAVKVEV